MNDTASLFDTEALLSDGIKSTPPSFVRSILKAASDPNVTSFAGGLPNPISFPEDELLKSMERVVAEQGPNAFQYSSTAGIDELRQWVADRYNKRFGTDYVLDDVLITTGSQQILDLLGKVLLDKGDGVIVENPTYLAAIQAFALQQPVFRGVELTSEGLNIDELNAALDAGAKMIYLIPNFQNPTGLTYTAENREQVREALSKHNIVVVEDDPYGELRFEGELCLISVRRTTRMAWSWGHSPRPLRPVSAWDICSRKTTTSCATSQQQKRQLTCTPTCLRSTSSMTTSCTMSSTSTSPRSANSIVARHVPWSMP